VVTNGFFFFQLEMPSIFNRWLKTHSFSPQGKDQLLLEESLRASQRREKIHENAICSSSRKNHLFKQGKDLFNLQMKLSPFFKPQQTNPNLISQGHSTIGFSSPSPLPPSFIYWHIDLQSVKLSKRSSLQS